MKVKIEVEIFDDPEYCEKDGDGCYFLNTDDAWCILFKDDAYNPNECLFVKCDQCIKAIKKQRS